MEYCRVYLSFIDWDTEDEICNFRVDSEPHLNEKATLVYYEEDGTRHTTKYNVVKIEHEFTYWENRSTAEHLIEVYLAKVLEIEPK